MAIGQKRRGYVCCFCGSGGYLDDKDFGILSLQVPSLDRKASQDLYCHERCLKEKTTPKFDTLFDLLNGQ